MASVACQLTSRLSCDFPAADVRVGRSQKGEGTGGSCVLGRAAGWWSRGTCFYLCLYLRAAAQSKGWVSWGQAQASGTCRGAAAPLWPPCSPPAGRPTRQKVFLGTQRSPSPSSFSSIRRVLQVPKENELMGRNPSWRNASGINLCLPRRLSLPSLSLSPGPSPLRGLPHSRRYRRVPLGLGP
jgi:hypothetical protein